MMHRSRRRPYSLILTLAWCGTLLVAAVDAAEDPPRLDVAEPAAVEQAVGVVVDAVEAVQIQRALPALRLQPAIQAVEVREIPAVAPRAAGDNPGVVLVKKSDAKWKYWDSAKDPGADWAETDFDDQQWAAGPGPLGYGDQHIKTPVGFGNDPNAKHVVVFFRHTFQVEDPSAMPHLAGAILCDDAAAVYLNGREVYRRNLPQGNLEPSTLSTAAIAGDDEKTYWEFVADGKLLRKGTNTIAVRVHQANQSSSDLGFDLELRCHGRASPSKSFAGMVVGPLYPWRPQYRPPRAPRSP